MPFKEDPQPQATSGFVPDQPDTSSGFTPDTDKSLFTPDNALKAWTSVVYGKMLDTSPGYIYQNHEEVDKQIRERGGDDFDKGVGYAAKTGFESTPLGLIIRGKSPEPFASHSKLGNFIHDVSEFASDPLMLASAFSSPEGVGVGGFAADASLRKTLVDQYEKGNVKNFGELASRVGSVLWEGAKGAMVAKVAGAAGEIPAGNVPLASAGLKGLYQSAAITTAGNLLNGQLPSVNDFERSSLLIVPLNLATGGAFLRNTELKQAQMDVYKDTGVKPEESALKQQAQPTVKPDLKPGLRPAIKLGKTGGVLEGDVGQKHSDLAETIAYTKPVELDELRTDFSLAPRVLQVPEIHEQAVIDKALGIVKDFPELLDPLGTGIKPINDKPKSGRGFVDPEGKFLTREQARSWMKENEPEVHQMWLDGKDGDAQAELHSEDYGIARFRVSGRDVMEGEPDYKGMDPDLQKFLSVTRSQINSMDDFDTSYGRTTVRKLFDGPRKMLRAEGEQVVSRGRKLVKDPLEQEAMSFMRDYRDDPEALRSDIEEIREGKNQRLKAFIPAMERALEPPSPEMQKADADLTQYASKSLDLGRQVGTLDSSIDPSRYSPRLFMDAVENAEKPQNLRRPVMTKKTPHSIQREYLRLLDPLKMEGGKEARTFNVFDEFSIYADRHATSIATKLFETELKNSKLGTEGTEEDHPDGWEKMSLNSKFYVPPKIADALRPMLTPGESQVAKFLHVQNIVKAGELTLSLFHPKALTFVAMNNMQMDAYGKALLTSNESPEFEAAERFGALHGLETSKTGKPYEAYEGLQKSSLPKEYKTWVGKGLGKLKGNAVVEAADAVFKAQTKWIFDGVQRRYKVIDFATRAQGWEGNHPNATPEEYGKAMSGIAKEVNSGYGGLNWDVMGVSQGMRQLSRVILLAPDWTFSNFLQAKYAFEGGPGGTAARLFWLRSTTMGLAMTQATSQMIGGKHVSFDDLDKVKDRKDAATLLQHLTSVYLGKDKDGRDKYSNWYFSASTKDAVTLMTRVMRDGPFGMAEFTVNKLGPFFGTLIGAAANKQYGLSGPPIYKQSDTEGKMLKEEGEFVARKALPITVSSILEMLTDDKEHKWSEYLTAAAGMPTQTEGRKSTPGKSSTPGMSKSPIGIRRRSGPPK